MKILVLAILLLFLTTVHLYGQRSLTKDEILKHWSLPSDEQIRDSIGIVDSDSTLNVRLVELVDSLQTKKIDSVIIYSIAYPGYFSMSKCDTEIFPITTFVIWNNGGVTYIRKLQGNCLSEITKDSSSHLFDFYNDNYQKLKSESFMPVILSGRINKDKTVSYAMSWSSDEPKYSFYYKIGNNSKSYHFCQSYLDNKESLFHDYNLTLSAYHWWQLVKLGTDKLD